MNCNRQTIFRFIFNHSLTTFKAISRDYTSYCHLQIPIFTPFCWLLKTNSKVELNEIIFLEFKKLNELLQQIVSFFKIFYDEKKSDNLKILFPHTLLSIGNIIRAAYAIEKEKSDWVEILAIFTGW